MEEINFESFLGYIKDINLKNDSFKEYDYLNLIEINKYKELIDKLEIDKTTKRFLITYKKINGDYTKLSDKWKRKRHGFIKRNIINLPEFNKINPSKQYLSLIMWAYLP